LTANKPLKWLCWTALAACAAAAPAKAGEFQAWAYGGYIYTFPSDVTLQPDRNSPTFTYKDVHWEGKPFTPPPYWGVRGTYWFDAYPGWGVGFDYSHIKVIAERPPALDAIASHFEYTDGLNTLTIDAMYRRHLFDRFTGYAGAGVGVAVPSVEVTLRPPYDTTPTHQYELGGPAVQGKIGLEYEIGWNVSAFTEYKIAYSSNDVSIKNGGREKDDFLTNQFIFGLSYSLR
jgi:lipid A oxidase